MSMQKAHFCFFGGNSDIAEVLSLLFRKGLTLLYYDP